MSRFDMDDEDFTPKRRNRSENEYNNEDDFGDIGNDFNSTPSFLDDDDDDYTPRSNSRSFLEDDEDDDYTPRSNSRSFLEDDEDDDYTPRGSSRSTPSFLDDEDDDYTPRGSSRSTPSFLEDDEDDDYTPRGRTPSFLDDEEDDYSPRGRTRSTPSFLDEEEDDYSPRGRTPSFLDDEDDDEYIPRARPNRNSRNSFDDNGQESESKKGVKDVLMGKLEQVKEVLGIKSKESSNDFGGFGGNDSGSKSKPKVDIKAIMFILLIVFIIIFVATKSMGGEDTKVVDKEPTPTQVEKPIVDNNSSNTDTKPNETASETKHEVDLVENSSEEVVQNKAEELSKEEGYIDNVEETKGNVYNRTSLYDKPIGRITAQYVKIDSVIYAGASELNMRRGVATVEFEEQLNEKTVAIAGHRGVNAGEYFTGILYLNMGDYLTVEMWDEYGNVTLATQYQVEGYNKVEITDISVLEDDPNDTRRKLILITCADYNPETGKYEKRWVTTAYEVR